MKKLLFGAFAAVLVACNDSKPQNTDNPADTDSTSVAQDTVAVATDVPQQPLTRVADKLTVSKEEALRAWKALGDYLEVGKPDSYLCYDVDADGVHEVFLANRKVKDGDARAVFLVQNNGKLKCILHTVYPTPGAAKFSFYLTDGHILSVVENHGQEYTAYLLSNSKVERMAYNSMLIVGWDDKEDKPIYEFEEEGQPMIGKDMEHLEPSDEAKKYLDPQVMTEIYDIDGWQTF